MIALPYTVSDGTATATGAVSVYGLQQLMTHLQLQRVSITTTEDTAGTLDLSTLSSDVDGDTLNIHCDRPIKRYSYIIRWSCYLHANCGLQRR